MITEIFCRMPSDKNYRPIVETQSEHEQILQRIRTLLGTKHGQVMGDFYFGIDLEQYLFRYGFPTSEVQRLLNEQIDYHCNIDPKKYSLRCEVSYGQDHYNRSDYALIDIFINNEKLLGVIAK